MKRLILVLTLFVLSVPAFAVQPDEVLADPALEARARDISADLRCLVCQNQSIDDSDADLARDLRILVRERLVEGDTNDEVKQFLVDRYGEFVLLNPRVGTHTLVLWFAAPAALIVAIVGVFLRARRRKTPNEGAIASSLTPEEQAALDRLSE